MKIHLIKSPEYPSQEFEKVSDLLKSFEGPLQFIPSKYEFQCENFYFLEYNLYPKHPFQYSSNQELVPFDPNKGYPLSWKELFFLCQYYRKNFSIDDENFVVLLTQRKNALNWFSAFDESRNIFVHTAEWEQFTQYNQPKYPIAYEIIANILGVLMNIALVHNANPYVHEPPIGCMNDFCYNKSQVILKLQTANICPTCLRRIESQGISMDILKQVKAIFNGIRNEYVFRMEEQPAQAAPLVVQSNGQIMLPSLNLELRLNPLFKTLYIFYLQHPEGIKLSDLRSYQNELLTLYQRLSVSDSSEKIAQRIQELTHPYGNSFSEKKSKINRTITQLLGKKMATYYRIDGAPGEAFRIPLPAGLVDIRF